MTTGRARRDEHGGYFLVARKLYRPGSWLWTLGPLYVGIWTWMIARARWADNPERIFDTRKRKIVLVERGRFVASERTIAQRCRVSRKVVRTLIAAAIADGALQAHKGPGRGTTYVLVNYEVHQDAFFRRARDGPEAGPVGDHSGTGKNSGELRGTQGGCARARGRPTARARTVAHPESPPPEQQRPDGMGWEADELDRLRRALQLGGQDGQHDYIAACHLARQGDRPEPTPEEFFARPGLEGQG